MLKTRHAHVERNAMQFGHYEELSKQRTLNLAVPIVGFNSMHYSVRFRVFRRHQSDKSEFRWMSYTNYYRKLAFDFIIYCVYSYACIPGAWIKVEFV